MKITKRHAAVALFTVVFIGFWILLHYLYSSFISQSEFEFSVLTDLVLPAAAGVILGISIIVLRDRLRRG